MKTYNILIVDDVAQNIQILGNILHEHPFNIAFATNGKDAIKMLENTYFDLLLLDVMMPEIDGYQVCQQIKSNPKLKELPIIFLTAKADKENIVKGLSLGAQDYVTKPFNGPELLARIHTHLELSEKKKELNELNKTLEQKVKERTLELEAAYLKLEEYNGKLKNLEKAKSDFLLLIGHELRTPLNWVLGFMQLLEITDLNKEQKEYLDSLKSGTERLRAFSEAAILLTQLKANHYHLSPTASHLSSSVQNILSTFGNKFLEKKITVSKNIPDDLYFYADEKLFSLCLQNLLNNSLKHSIIGGSIEVTATVAKKSIDIYVYDNGTGFSEEALNNMHTVISAADMINHDTGFGLGLATVKFILEAHGGSFSAGNRLEKGAYALMKFPELKE